MRIIFLFFCSLFISTVALPQFLTRITPTMNYAAYKCAELNGYKNLVVKHKRHIIQEIGFNDYTFSLESANNYNKMLMIEKMGLRDTNNKGMTQQDSILKLYSPWIYRYDTVFPVWNVSFDSLSRTLILDYNNSMSISHTCYNFDSAGKLTTIFTSVMDAAGDHGGSVMTYNYFPEENRIVKNGGGQRDTNSKGMTQRDIMLKFYSPSIYRYDKELPVWDVSFDSLSRTLTIDYNNTMFLSHTCYTFDPAGKLITISTSSMGEAGGHWESVTDFPEENRIVKNGGSQTIVWDEKLLFPIREIVKDPYSGNNLVYSYHYENTTLSRVNLKEIRGNKIVGRYTIKYEFDKN